MPEPLDFFRITCSSFLQASPSYSILNLFKIFTICGIETPRQFGADDGDYILEVSKRWKNIAA